MTSANSQAVALGTRPQHALSDVGEVPRRDESIRTVADVTRLHARRRPSHTATVFEGRSTTYRELDVRASKIANALRAEGLRKGDRVVYIGKNSDEYFELYFGCAKAGVVLVPAGWRLSPGEITYIAKDAGAKLLFVGAELVNCVTGIAPDLPEVRLIVFVGHTTTDWPGFAQWYGARPAIDPMIDVAATDPMLQLYTSGTTGRPKGAQLSHQNLIVAGFEMCAEPWATWRPEDVSLVTMPVAHISGTGWGFFGYCAGSTNVITREFDPFTTLAHIEGTRVTRLFAVPAAIQMMLRLPFVGDVDFSSLKYVVYGASPIPLDLLRKAVQVFQCGFCQLYGMTETTGPIVYLPPEDHDPAGNPRMRGAGKPYPHVQLRVRRADGTLAGPNETGELETRSALNMLGYWRLPAASSEVRTEDGWIRTGDAGYLDADGYLYIQDRVKDMIITGAENVYPAEVESAIYGCPDVAEVAVIGVPDERWGEAVKAIVVPAPGCTPDAAEIIAFTKKRIAHFKAPKSVDFIEALPRNASGKVLRRQLRKPYWAGYERQVN